MPLSPDNPVMQSQDKHHPNADTRANGDQDVVSLFGRTNLPPRIGAAPDGLRYLPGAAGVANLLSMKSSVHPVEVKAEIIAALQRFAQITAERIRVSVLNKGQVVLEGRVHSWDEREIIHKAVSSLPGVQSVTDNLTLS